jgi:hypothetical protein
MMKLFLGFNFHLPRLVLLLALGAPGSILLAGAPPDPPVRARPFVACVSASASAAPSQNDAPGNATDCLPPRELEPRVVCVEVANEARRFWFCWEIPADAVIDSVAKSEAVTFNLQSIIDMGSMLI